jgi:hypothetical protein
MGRREELNAKAAELRELQDEADRRVKAREVERASLAPHRARQLSNRTDTSVRFIDSIRTIEDTWNEIASRAAAGDSSAIADALVFLEVRPRFFRSGYLAERIMRRLVQAPDLVPYSDRIGVIAIGYAKSGAQRESKLVSKLVGKAWTFDLAESLELELANAESGKQESEASYLRRVLDGANHWRRSRPETAL